MHYKLNFAKSQEPHQKEQIQTVLIYREIKRTDKLDFYGVTIVNEKGKEIKK